MLAYTVNRLGTWFGVVALSLAVFDQTHSALAVAALLVAAQVIPAFLVPAVVVLAALHERARGRVSDAPDCPGRGVPADSIAAIG